MYVSHGISICAVAMGGDLGELGDGLPKFEVGDCPYLRPPIFGKHAIEICK